MEKSIQLFTSCYFSLLLLFYLNLSAYGLHPVSRTDALTYTGVLNFNLFVLPK
jgi:hypothetical protein